MSKEDVAIVFYDSLKMRCDTCEEQLRYAKTCTLGLRTRLRELDTSLPDVFAGSEWWPLEQEWAERWATSDPSRYTPQP